MESVGVGGRRAESVERLDEGSGFMGSACRRTVISYRLVGELISYRLSLVRANERSEIDKGDFPRLGISSRTIPLWWIPSSGK